MIKIEGKYTPDYTGANGEYTDDAFVDNPTVIALTDSLRGMGTGWCTAGARTAAHQLSMGDFYVYYTQDEEGEDTIPRIAIRMENGVVAEVRGIEPDQEVEPVMLDIVAEKLRTLPGGDEYYQKVADMKWITWLYSEHTNGGRPALSAQELARLYGFKESLRGFGFGRDPRVDEIRKGRYLIGDLTTIFTDERYNAWCGDLYLRRLTTAEGLKFPETIGGRVRLPYHLKSLIAIRDGMRVYWI